MAIRKRNVNYHVIVYPQMWPHGLNDPKWAPQAAKDLKEAIQRHCDVAEVLIHWDAETVCSFCDYSWEVNEDGCPVCCDAAIKEFASKEGPLPEEAPHD